MISSEAKGCYSRLFPVRTKPLSTTDEEQLIQLGEAMRYNVEREGTLTPRVGYTYFSQFVGHDLTHDPTPLEGPYLEPHETLNHRTPYLDLDHVYGGGPEKSPELYHGEPGAELFKLGVTTPTGYPRDLPIEHGTLLLSDGEDTRDLDNLILRQLHALFLQFHNEAVKQLSAKRPTITGFEHCQSRTIFEEAQQLIRWHYQWIVRHDLLPRILHPDLWNTAARRVWAAPQQKHDFTIPIEFSLAAFRFGHSMVRNAYGLNCRQTRVTIADLMALGHKPSPVPDNFLIEWGRFFDGLLSSGPVASSSYIDTSIAASLHDLSPSIIRLSNKTEHSLIPSSLPVRTLLRGARAKLPSGQEVADLLIRQGVFTAESYLTPAQLTRDTCNNAGKVLQEVGLDKDTPLFFYLLKEAELSAGGRTLGPIASYIVANVIEGALRADLESYVSVVGPDWKLPRWRFPSGSDEQVDCMIKIVRLVGDNQLLPECEAKWRSFLPVTTMLPHGNWN